MSLLITAIFAFSFGVQTAPPKSDPVWFWFATCGGPIMTVEVRVQGTVIQKVVVPLCRAMREAASSQGQTGGQVHFSFRPRRPMVWSGYRDTDDRTRAGQVLEGSLWEAGADPDAILVGVSFSSSGRSLVNTIHIAHPDRRDESMIAPSVTVATYPSR